MAASVVNKQPPSGDTDCFRDAFKYYKKRKPPPNFDHVIDFTNVASEKVMTIHLTSPTMVPPVDLKDVAEWKAYGHVDFPGFVFIVNPFKSGFQRYWVKRCLVDYPDKPSRCNLDAHIQVADGDNLWQLSQQQHSQKNNEEKTLIDKLRWVTLGYHHDWATKQYSNTLHTDMPEDLTYLSQYVACCLGSQHFTAEAAIVNYYHLDSTLSGHTDHSEFDLKAPLVSFSLGQTAIFLLGGITKATEPVAVYLRSGDITVLSGDSRLAYHAVPRILPQHYNTFFADSFDPPDVSTTSQPCRLMQAQMVSSLTQVSTHQAGDVSECCVDTDDTEQKQTDVPKCVVCSSFSNDGTVARNSGCTCNNLQCGRDDVQEASVVNPECHVSCDHGFVDNTAKQTNEAILQTLQDMTWDPLAEYIAVNRINMNVRQVLEREQPFPSAATDVSVSHSLSTS